MIWRAKSFGTLDLLTDYFAFFVDADNPNMQPPVELGLVEVGEAAPAEAGLTRKEDYVVLTVTIEHVDKNTKYEALVMAFDSLKSSSQKLVCVDNDNSEWYVMGRVVNHAMTAMTSKITLQVADSVWRSNSETSDVWSITASDQTRNITVGGTVEALPIFEIKPTSAKTGGFGYRAWVRLYNPNDEAVVNELVDITNGGLNTAALVTAGKMQSDGDDVRVYEGTEVDRFLYAMNTSATKIFAGPFHFKPKIEMTLSGAIASSGSVTAIYVKDTPTNKTLLNRLPNQRGVIEIDNERFIYTGRNVSARRIDIALRAVRKSSMAAHADGAIIKWMEHDVWLYYGDATLIAPETDSLHQAAFDLATSTNGSHVYTSFGDKAGVMPGGWRSAVLESKGKKSIIYTGDHGDITADPITDMGMALKAYKSFGVARAETAILEWKFSHPGKITSVTVTGEKRRINNSKWPDFAGLQKSKNGTNWVDQFDEGIPAAGSYVTITNTGSQALGAGYKHVRFLLDGSTAATLDAEADLEIDSVTVVITNPISAALQTEESDYDLNCEIQNVTTGQSLFVRWAMGLNETLTVDSEVRRLTYSDGTNAYQAKRLDAPRLEYLPFKPGVVNQLKFIDAGTAGLTLTTRYTKRRKR